MRIIAHRGYWIDESEKNTIPAFERAVSGGFGIETDFRDHDGTIVISHDPANDSSVSMSEFLSLLRPETTLALNIKADGLVADVKRSLLRSALEDYFVFDMSCPDQFCYLKENVVFFSRQSEYENHPLFYQQCSGIWMDSFNNEWFSAEDISSHLKQGKRVCVVSSELHKREHSVLWQKLLPFKDRDDVMLCTDFPEQAEVFFNGNY